MSANSEKVDMFFDKNRVYLKDVLPLDTPFSINIEISSLCNIHCKYCIHSLKENELKKVHKLSVMQMETFIKIIDQLKEFPQKIKTLCINGVGEPLCNKNFIDMITYAKQSAVAERIEFFTNGILLDSKISQGIVNAKIDRVKISLQGLTDKKYKEVCGVNVDYDKLYNNIKYFSEIKGSCELFVKIINVGLDGDYDEFIKQYQDLCDKIYVEHVVKMFNEVNYDDLINEQDIIKNKYGKLTAPNKICPLPFYRLYINVEGDVSFCFTIRNPVKAYNINDKSIFQIWNSRRRYNFLIKMLESTCSSNSICSKCTMMCEAAFSEYDNIDDYSKEILQRIVEKHH